MLNNKPNTAILLFTNTTSVDAQRKQFSTSDGFYSSEKVISKLIDFTTKKIEKTNLPYFVFSTEEQIGNTFGERLSNAISDVFKNGYNNVIVLGNDCPHITSSHILKANELFNHHQLIIGPTIKGGSYLIGISKNSFHKTSFEKLKWESSFLLNDLKEYASLNTNSFFLSNYYNDLNNSTDLKRYVSLYMHSQGLAKNLVLLYRKIISNILSFFCFYYQKQIPYYFNTKAPPLTLI